MGNVPNSQTYDIVVSSAAAFIPLPQHICSAIDILNTTDVDVMVRQDDNGVAGTPYKCLSKSTYLLQGLQDANEVWIALGTAGSPVTITYRLYA